MSAFVEPLRLVLLAETEWSSLLRDCLQTLGNPATLITAPSWDAACSLFDGQEHGLLLSTPANLPAAGRCHLSTVLLLEQEPPEAPAGVSDWLVRDSLSADVLRRCLRYVCKHGQLQNTVQRLTEQDPLTAIANRQPPRLSYPAARPPERVRRPWPGHGAPGPGQLSPRQ